MVRSSSDVRTKPPLAGPLAGRGDRPLPRRLFDVVRRFVWHLMAHDSFTAAASIAFWSFLSLVPLLALAGFLIGLVARTRGVDALVEPILEIAPGSTTALVSKEITRMAGANAAPVAPLGVAGFMWTASSGLHNLMDVFETAVKARRRPWWKQRAMALGWVLAGLAAACAIAWVLVKTDGLLNAYDSAHESAGELPSPASPALSPSPSPSPRPGGERVAQTRAATASGAPHSKTSLRRRMHRALATPDEKMIAAVLLLVTGFALLAGFYRFAVEHPPGVRRRVLPGAFTAVGSWLVVSWAFGEYAGSIADYALYYGGLAAVAILLLWLYLTSLSLVIGAEVNAQFEGLRAGRAGGRDAGAIEPRRPAA